MTVSNPSDPTFAKFRTTSRAARSLRSHVLVAACIVVSALSIIVLFTLLGAIVLQGLRVIRPAFFINPSSPVAAEAGIGPALVGTFWVCLTCALLAVPLGVGTGILLEEFQPRTTWGRQLHAFLQLNIANLAGVPSIVYGLLGLTAFASMFGLLGTRQEPRVELGVRYYFQYVTEGANVVFVPIANADMTPDLSKVQNFEIADGSPTEVTLLATADPLPDDQATLAYALRDNAEGGLVKRHRWYYLRLPFGRSVLAASLTLMLVILPMVIVSSQKALRAVPRADREASLGLGATTWQTARHVALPSAFAEIVSGSLLAISRAAGEAAPILMLAGIVYISNTPSHLMDDYTVLPIQIFYWATLPVDRDATVNFQHVAAGGIIVLLAIILTLNGIASFLRSTAGQKSS